MLDRLTRYIRRAAHLPTTMAFVDERLQRVETQVAAAIAAEHGGNDGVDGSEAAPPVPMYTPAPHPILRAEHVQGAVLYADRIDALAAIPENGRVAEIGVAAGDFSDSMLRILCPQSFDAFDIFRLHEVPLLWGRSTHEWFEGRTHREFYESRFRDQIAAGVVNVFEGDSSVVMAAQPERYYDMIYIDGDHSREGVLRDAEAAVPKLKEDGILVFNDYTMMDHVSISPYGIVPVVNEFCVNRGWTVVYLALQHELFCDIALKRKA